MFDVCHLCREQGRFDEAIERARVQSNVREFQDESFTVWRCHACGSLHSREDIDLERYYRDYPVARQSDDAITRLLFRRRLRELRSAGLAHEHRVLDYGCGNGGFVKYLVRTGHTQAVGYDPYSEEYCNRATLAHRYDFVVCQDVIEHASDPARLVGELLDLLSPGGVLLLGTPNALALSLDDPIDVAGHLHQPYHRHIVSQAALENLFAASGAAILEVRSRWYVDSYIPFINTRFFFRYVHECGGAIDVVFEPIKLGVIYGSLGLLRDAFFGRLLYPGKETVLIARKPEEKEEGQKGTKGDKRG